MDVFQCPECDLRFRFASELEDHLANDHPQFARTPTSVEGALVAAAPRHRRTAPDYPPGYKPDVGGLDRHVIASATEEVARDEAAPPYLHVSHLGLDRFSIHVRGHQVLVDQPVADGGSDSAPTPTELYVASLASCVAFYGSRFMRRHAIPGSIEVTARWTMGERPARVAAIELDVEAPIPPEKRARFSSVIEHCTVHNSFASPPEVSIRCVES